MSKFKAISILSAVVMAAGLAGNAGAAPINLTPFPVNPDVFVDQGVVTYSSTTRVLTLTGVAESVSGSPLTSGTFTATVTLNHVSGAGSTEVLSLGAGLLSVSSSAGSEFASSTPLLFGYSPTSADFQIVYGTSTGTGAVSPGKVAVSFHDGTSAGVYLTSFFGSNFNSSNIVKLGTADVFNTPEPASLAILGLAAPLMIRRRRRA